MPNSSIFANAPFEQFELTYSQSTGTGVDPSTGNPVEVTTTDTVLVTLAPFKATQVQPAPGITEKTMQVRGSFVTPRLAPAAITLGSILKLVYNGIDSRLTITNLTPPSIQGVAFGTYFEGTLEQ